MPFYIFQWTEEALEHIAQHGITRDEFTEIVERVGAQTVSRSSGLPMAFGQTSTGKYIGCIWQPIDEVEIIPVTAFESPEPR